MSDSLKHLLEQDERLVAGLMSGTSLDGVDAVVARLRGSGRGMQVEQRGFVHRSYPEPLRTLLLRNSSPATSSVYDLSQLNARLATVYAEAVREAAGAVGVAVTDLDLVGSHGQTVHHVPAPADCGGRPVASTLQIGDPSMLANLLGIPVVGDFRTADMALGGQGAPLVPYFDYVLFSDDTEARGLLNLGGIANLTVLPPAAEPADVRAFDTGPANMVIDALASRYFDVPFDEGGRLAAAGRVEEALLQALLDDPYFAQPPPRSTGRERFGTPFVEQLVQRGRERDLAPHDLLATATALTAHSVYDAYDRFLRAAAPLDVLLVAGGGRHNDTLMRMLGDAFAPVPVRGIDAHGLDPDAKEALCFAVLAHEYVNGVPTSLPSVTGASRPTLLGKLCVPGPGEAATGRG